MDNAHSQARRCRMQVQHMTITSRYEINIQAYTSTSFNNLKKLLYGMKKLCQEETPSLKIKEQ